MSGITLCDAAIVDVSDLSYTFENTKLLTLLRIESGAHGWGAVHPGGEINLCSAAGWL